MKRILISMNSLLFIIHSFFTLLWYRQSRKNSSVNYINQLWMDTSLSFRTQFILSIFLGTFQRFVDSLNWRDVLSGMQRGAIFCDALTFVAHFTKLLFDFWDKLLHILTLWGLCLVAPQSGLLLWKLEALAVVWPLCIFWPWPCLAFEKT